MANVKEVIRDADTFTVKYSSELVDATVVTNEVNKIQNYVPPIAWVLMTLEDQGSVEYVTDGFSSPTNMDNRSTQNKRSFLQCVLYFLYTNTNYLHCYLLSNL